MRSLPTWVGVATIVALVAPSARADAPLLRVRARTRILCETSLIPGGVLVRGEVIDTRLRSGIPDRRVAITSGRPAGRVLALTDAHGRFEARVPLGPGAHRLRIETIEDARYGSAEPVLRRIEITAPIPRRWLTLPLAATAALLVGLGLARLLPLRRRRETPRAAAPAARPGLHPARVGRRHALRARDEHGFSGEVRDVATSRPVPGAIVVIEPEASGPAVTSDPEASQRRASSLINASQRRASTSTDGAGRFEAGPLPPGRYRVTVRATGYLAERFAVSLPHRGELRGARVDLKPVRLRVLEVYREQALGLLPDPELLWVWTPRELSAHVPGVRPLHDLGHVFEEAWYSGRPSPEAAIAEAERLAAEVRAATTPRPPA